MKSKILLLITLINFISLDLLTKVFAELRAIDRTTGRTYKIKAPLNTEVKFSNLIINVTYCYKNPIDKEIENFAYINIKDGLRKKFIFQGWMFSSSPSLSSLEHPINDIWLLECT